MNKNLNGLRTTVISAWEATHTLDITRKSKMSLSLCSNRSAHIYPLLVRLTPMIRRLLPFSLKLRNQAQAKARLLPKLPTNRSSNHLSNHTPWLTTRRPRCEGLRNNNSMLHLTIHKTSNCIKHRPASIRVLTWARSQVRNHSIRSRLSPAKISNSSSNKYQFIHSFNLTNWHNPSQCHSISTG